MLTWLHLLPPFWRLSPNDLDLPPIIPFYPNLKGLGSDRHSTTKNIAFEKYIAVQHKGELLRPQHNFVSSIDVLISVAKVPPLLFPLQRVQRVNHSRKWFCTTVGFQILFLYSTNILFYLTGSDVKRWKKFGSLFPWPRKIFDSIKQINLQW